MFKIAALTAALAVLLVLSVYLGNKRGADITTAFDPWLYVSHMMEVLGLKNRLTNVVAFLGIAGQSKYVAWFFNAYIGASLREACGPGQSQE